MKIERYNDINDRKVQNDRLSSSNVFIKHLQNVLENISISNTSHNLGLITLKKSQITLKSLKLH